MRITMDALQAVLDSDRNRWIIGLALVPVATVAWYYLQQRSNNRDVLRRRRTVSFSSLALALGSFPLDAEVPAATINQVLYFEDLPPTVDAIAQQVVEPLLRYERMSHVLDMKTGCFQPSPLNYQPKDLVRQLEIHGDDDSLTNRTIFEHLQDVLSEGRDGLPWWEILVVQNRGSGPSALVVRVHHTLADGLALMHAFQSNILTDEKGSPVQTLATMSSDDKDSPPPPPSKQAANKKNIFSTIWSFIEATINVLTLGSSKFDDDTAFSKCNHAQMRHNGKRDFIIFPTVPLDFIKELKTAANCTVNDILMSAVSQAIHDYCQNKKDPVLAAKESKIQCRALLPVGFPRSTEELSDPTTAMRNKWCMVSCDIGVGCSNSMERLAAIRSSTTAMKTKPQAIMQLVIQNTVVPLLPKNLARQAVLDVFSRHSLVLTNVPGPSQICVVAGKKIQGVQLFFNNIVTQVDFISYAGKVFGNIVYDPEALPDFADFGLHYGQALLQLAERLRVQPPADLVPATTEDE